MNGNQRRGFTLHACLFQRQLHLVIPGLASVNYMSPPLNIKPNQRLIIDAIAFYASVPLLVQASGKELFLH